jgi:hypothetical protein
MAFGHGGGGGGGHGGGGMGGFHGGGVAAFHGGSVGAFHSGNVAAFRSGNVAAFNGAAVRSNSVRGSFAAMPAGAGVVAGHNWAGHAWNGHGGHGHRHFVRAFGVGGYGYYDGSGYYDDSADYSTYYQGTCSSYYYDQNGNAYCADGGTSFNAVGW